MLLDTHVWVWYASAAPSLSPKVLAQIQQAELATDLYLRPISLWEITLKVSQQTIELGLPTRLWLQRAILSTGIHLTQINIDVACDCAELLADFHGDPADRLIAATARTQGITLVTHDHRLLKLAEKGYFKARPSHKVIRTPRKSPISFPLKTLDGKLIEGDCRRWHKTFLYQFNRHRLSRP